MVKKSVFALLLLILIFTLTACGDWSNSEEQENERTEDQQEVYAKAQPVPVFDWSLQRHLLIQWYQLENRSVNTWSVERSLTGEVLSWCPSMGFPIPGDTQLTNPWQRVDMHESVVAQPEPNGLFSSAGTDSTLVMCVRDGKIVPFYSEHKISTYLYPIDVVDGQVVDLGQEPSATFNEDRR